MNLLLLSYPTPAIAALEINAAQKDGGLTHLKQFVMQCRHGYFKYITPARQEWAVLSEHSVVRK